MDKGKGPTEVTLKISFDDPVQAEAVARALMVDDDDYVTTELKEGDVIGRVKSDSVQGARRAADDWLACLMAIIKGSGP
ncbi:MAG: KEOPS complex subunit Pcc1 [Thermoplasmatota archaeon]